MNYKEVLKKANRLNLCLRYVGQDYHNKKYTKEEEQEFRILLIDLIISHLTLYYYIGGEPILLNIKTAETERVDKSVKLLLFSVVAKIKLSKEIYTKIKELLETEFKAQVKDVNESDFGYSMTEDEN